MVVIVIIGLLATIVALNVLPSGDTARVQKAKADIATIESGLELYRLQIEQLSRRRRRGCTRWSPRRRAPTPRAISAAAISRSCRTIRGAAPYLYASPGQHGEADVWSYGADGKEGGEGIDADIGSWQ